MKAELMSEWIQFMSLDTIPEGLVLMPVSLVPYSPEPSQECLIDEQNTGEYDMFQVYSYERWSFEVNYKWTISV